VPIRFVYQATNPEDITDQHKDSLLNFFNRELAKLYRASSSGLIHYKLKYKRRLGLFRLLPEILTKLHKPSTASSVPYDYGSSTRFGNLDILDRPTIRSKYYPNTPLSSVSSYLDTTSKKRNDIDPYVPFLEGYLGNYSYNYKEILNKPKGTSLLLLIRERLAFKPLFLIREDIKERSKEYPV
ncbi:uncharacterized protein N7496_003451, partial [Penicillium cataractarum]